MIRKTLRSLIRFSEMSTSTFPPGTPLYQTNASLHEHATTIVACQPIATLSESDQLLFKAAQDGDYVVTTENTIFHPQGGGQPSDRGQIRSDEHNGLVFDVKLVRKAPGNTIYHLGSFAHPNQLFQPGESTVQRIDTATRNYHSRYHTAGHILGLAVRELKDQVGDMFEVKANHAPGMAFVEFRGLIAGEHKGIIQEKVNELQQKNLAVEVDWWDEVQAKARCAALPEGFAVPEDGNIRVVAVESLGAYPCGGTHLPTTVDVGGIVVRKISRQKGISKISYEIGDIA